MKFNLREMMLLILTIAIALGWWIDHRKQSKRDLAERVKNAKLAHEASEMLELCARFGWMLRLQEGCSVEWKRREKLVILRDKKREVYSSGGLDVDDFDFERVRVRVERD